MKIERVDCWIEADGKALDEYGVELSEEGNKCSAWIPSKAGQEFIINWRDPVVTRSTAGYISADGNALGGEILRPGQTTVKREGAHINASEIRNFRFAEVKLTDDDAYLNQNLQNVGEIKVEIWLCHVGGDTVSRQLHLAESTQMHEKSKKGLAHSVAFSKPKRLQRPVTFSQVHKIGTEPLATFTFRYRGLDMLRANGIVPMPAPAAPSRESRSVSSTPAAGPSRGRKRKATDALTPQRDVKPMIIDMEEEAEVEERIRKAEDELRRARLEMHRRRGNTRIKLEQVLPILPGEVFDLTGLDSD